MKFLNANLPVVVELVCGICQSRGYLRTRPEQALNVALAGGWMVISHPTNNTVCMVHNPSRVEFWAYRRQVAAIDLAAAL